MTNASTSVIAVIAKNENLLKNAEIEPGIPFIDPNANPERYPPNDIGIGNLLADIFKNYSRFVKDSKRWYFYDGCRWKEDVEGIVIRQRAKSLVAYLDKLGFEDFAGSLYKRTRRETIIKEAQDVHPLSLGDFDADPYLFNCRNGTIDLRTGDFHAHNPEDFLSKSANVIYDPSAESKRWNRFIFEIMCGDENLSVYLQKILGYGLSGETAEECLFILYGPTTRNGKGTLMESIHEVLGDYARTIQPATLAQRQGSGSAHSADIARLLGIRFVAASELAADMRLNAAMVKQLTGGDTVTTRFLYQNFFEYRPQFKFFINTNFLPQIGDDSLFASGRLRLIPFDKHFEDSEQDRGLKAQFREVESKSAIFNWLIEGYKRYKSEGLTPPPKAEELLREYRINSNPVGLYVKNRLAPCDSTERRKTSEFHADFIEWCQMEDIPEMSLKDFVNALRQNNLLARDRAIGNYIRGYKIKDN